MLYEYSVLKAIPVDSLIPYISVTGMFKLIKNSRVSFMMGAAADMAILHLSRPSA